MVTGCLSLIYAHKMGVLNEKRCKQQKCNLLEDAYNTAQRNLSRASEFLDERLPNPYICKKTQEGGYQSHKRTKKRRVKQNRTLKRSDFLEVNTVQVRSPVKTRSKSAVEPGGKEIKP